MRGWIVRAAVLVAATTGLLVLFGAAAFARWVPDQHCEPLQRGVSR
jgi:hypothetical protein